MVPARHRISRGNDFHRTLKKGVRYSSRDLVVTVLAVPAAASAGSDIVRCGGPRLGLIVSKAVGGSVQRHRVARRLRAAFRETDFGAALPHRDVLVVVRALPSSLHRSSTELAQQLSEAFVSRRVLQRIGDPA